MSSEKSDDELDLKPSPSRLPEETDHSDRSVVQRMNMLRIPILILWGPPKMHSDLSRFGPI